ncbi:MAG: hypothetical protein ACRDRS_21570 [Pseudonocardiaceae bacterium]
MSATSESTTGIPNTEKPGWWLVPPWPAHASLCDVVRHFLRSAPRDNASVAEKLAYCKGYLAAIEAAPTHELKYDQNWRWYEDLHDSIGRCVTIYQNERATEIQQANRDVQSLRPAAPAPHAAPTPQEQAS